MVSGPTDIFLSSWVHAARAIPAPAPGRGLSGNAVELTRT